MKIPFDANSPWKLYRVPVDQIELKNSPWDQIRSAPGILVFGKSFDATFYRVAVNNESLPWLCLNKYKFTPDLEPLEADEAEMRHQGIWAARCNAEERLLQALVETIRLGLGPGFESAFREIIPQHYDIILNGQA